MGRVIKGWLVLGILLGTIVCATAEDITLTTYYPSPRGVYQTLRSTGQTTLAETGGNVGVGTANPNTGRLHVVGGNIFLTNTDAWGVSMIVNNVSGGHTWRWVTGGAAGDGNVPAGGMAIHHDGNNSPIQIKSDGTVFMNVGNVGIGTGTPDQRLHVVGQIHATDIIYSDSDARFKQDVQPLGGALGKLDGLTPVSYVPSALGVERGQTPATRRLGLLGQELEQVFPELVVVSGDERYRAVDYSRLTVVLLEAVKELKAEIARLRASLAELEGVRP